MADKTNKTPGNVTGKYYVDNTCTSCGACWATAPDNFEEGEEFAFVKKQPENNTEQETCTEALDNCPTESIGDDGI